MPEETLEYWKAQARAQLDINSDWRTRCQKLEKELLEVKAERDRLRNLIQEVAIFCRDNGWHNVADELARQAVLNCSHEFSNADPTVCLKCGAIVEHEEGVG